MGWAERYNKVKKKLTFKAPEDSVLYRMLLFGFLMGAKENKSREAVRQLARIKKELFKVGEQFDHVEPINIMYLIISPTKMIKLIGGEIILPVGDWKKVEDHLENINWSPIDADIISDLYDRLDSMEKIDE
jgi:hypothetical protein